MFSGLLGMWSADMAIDLGKAFALTDGSGMRYWEAELYRLKGELLLASPDGRRRESESCFH